MARDFWTLEPAGSQLSSETGLPPFGSVVSSRSLIASPHHTSILSRQPILLQQPTTVNRKPTVPDSSRQPTAHRKPTVPLSPRQMTVLQQPTVQQPTVHNQPTVHRKPTVPLSPRQLTVLQQPTVQQPTVHNQPTVHRKPTVPLSPHQPTVHRLPTVPDSTPPVRYGSGPPRHHEAIRRLSRAAVLNLRGRRSPAECSIVNVDLSALIWCRRHYSDANSAINISL